MFHHPRVAMVAADLRPAGTAQRHRRITAAVEKQHRLFAAPDAVGHAFCKGFGDPAVSGQAFAAHVDGLHDRHRGRAEAGGQVQSGILACLGIGPTFKAGRGGRQHHWATDDRGAKHRHVAGIVKDTVFLLVGGVVFLIHHDQAKVLERQEKGGARADHQLRFTLPQHLPQPAAFGHRHARMPFGGPRAKAGFHPSEEIGRQGDFG